MINVERFWKKVEKTNGCWVWVAGKYSNGYGSFCGHGQSRLAHRISWYLTYGEWPVRELNHKCRNRACVNPDHLEDVSRQVNLLDSPVTLAALNVEKTHCPQGHEYNEINTQFDAKGGRMCRECGRIRSRDRYRKLNGVTPSEQRGCYNSKHRG